MKRFALGLLITLIVILSDIRSYPGSTSCLVAGIGTTYDSSIDAYVPCLAGTYYNDTGLNGTVTCEPCPKGNICLGGTSAPSVCAGGTYQDDTGQDICKICPSGYGCSSHSDPPVKCFAGTASAYAQENCVACLDGLYSDMGASYCLACPAGSECLSRDAATPCPPGQYSTSGISICVGCDPGEHTDEKSGATKCEVCEGGFSCEDSTKKPLKCDDGDYSSRSLAICLECPVGNCCPDKTTPVPCKDGTYSTGGKYLICDPCPAGKSCKSSSAESCEFGKYSTKGVSTCQPCRGGYQCLTQTEEKECPLGSFSLVGDGYCTGCPAGQFCVDPFSLPQDCAIGYTTNGDVNQTMCVECKPGYLCDNPRVPSTVCLPGTYSLPDSFTCQPCPAGASCSVDTTSPCPAGTYSLLGEDICRGCPPGSACPYPDQVILIACTSGSFSIENQTQCTPCDAGYECPSTDKDSDRADCSLGSYSTGGQSVCTKCEAGRECPKVDGSENAYCLPGHYSIESNDECKACEAGHACPFTNSDSSYPCGSGTYAGEGQTVCNDCPPGFYCPTPEANDGGSTECADGSFSVGRQTSCTDCVPGTACPNPFIELILTCPPGTYSEAKAKYCTGCRAGEECKDTTSPGTACKPGYFSLGNQTSCTICPAGYICSDSAVPPRACVPGEFSNVAESTSCSPCTAGYICAEGSTSPTPKEGICPLGYYCEAQATKAEPCPAGYYGATVQLEAESDCTNCPPGYFCEEPTAGYPNALNVCPIGHYCELNTETKHKTPCPDGTYGPLYGQEQSSSCISCPEGRYCTQGSSAPESACPKGHYCEKETGNFGGSAKEPIACPAGSFTAEEGAKSPDECENCPAGYYCPSGAPNPQECPAGKFGPSVNAHDDTYCEPCTSGMACTDGGLTEPNSPCSPGYFCPRGSDRPNDPANACPAGSYTDAYNLTKKDECNPCPERFYCEKGTGGSNVTPKECCPGHFCKAETKTCDEHDCPPGTWSNRTDLATESECWECPRGSYCVAGSSTPGETCKAGFYCPPGTGSEDQFPCSSGSFSNKTGNVREEDCEDCILGHYCGAGTVDPKPCQPGTYNNQSSSSNVNSCQDCPAGYHCPINGTETPNPCQPGDYSERGESQCSPCPPGFYCDQKVTTDIDLITKTCPAGMYCPEGTAEPPNLLNYKCPEGFFCPSNCETPSPCPPKTFSDKTGLTSENECQICTAGYYCDAEGLTAPNGTCPPGYYCPKGTESATSNPCPASTFLNGTAAISSESCTTCLSGYYCDVPGMPEPKDCPAGHYCQPGTQSPQLCSTGTYNNKTKARTSTECSDCPGGYYCQGTGNEEPTGECWGGYYCTSGSDTPTPYNGTMGAICPVSFFCPNGSAHPQSCEEGKFVNIEGSRSESDCIDCICGQFCSGETSGLCKPGYYCYAGSATPDQHSAMPGYYAREGDCDQTICEKGTYAPGNHTSECVICEVGQYCNKSGMSETEECPAGHYCKYNTITPAPCPVGTFNREKGQTSALDCDICEARKYCSKQGLSEPEDDCEPGYYCVQGSTTGTPETVTGAGGPCPEGAYCLKGTSSPIECGQGTYNNATHGKNESYCLDCPPGKVCSRMGLREPDDECAAGFYCSGRSPTTEPEDETKVGYGGPCPVGHYCPVGTGTPKQCEPGTYNDRRYKEVCYNCTAGNYCEGLANQTICPKGFYCPEGTGMDWGRCPPGKYSDVEGLQKEDECQYCKAGYYCGEYNMVNTNTIQCDPGYYCKSGVNVSDPGTQPHTGDGGRCPTGSYCLIGTGEPEECQPGTYNPQIGSSNETDCLSCSAGHYCPDIGASSAEFNCSEGYYCCGGAKTDKPPGIYINDATCPEEGGYECPIGKYCPFGTETPLDCPEGSYSNRSGLGECDPCPAGYYCPDGVVDYTSYPCQVGYYCPEGTNNYLEHPCPKGKYGISERLKSADECEPCDAGHYCLGTSGLPKPDGPCHEGYYCLGGATGPRPNGLANYTDHMGEACISPANQTGGICPIGYYCRQGTGFPEPCPSGKFCNASQLADVSGDCAAGYYCASASTTDQPDDGITGYICPPGYYCLEATKSPDPCPAGTYGNGTGLESKASCSKCTAGFYCPGKGQTSPEDKCCKGHYCPPGSSSCDSHPCDPGYYCPEEAENQLLCESGYYQDQNTTAECLECPAGFYCEKSTVPITDYTSYVCPLGSYCPIGTTGPTSNLCPRGRYGGRTALEKSDDCEMCPTGKHCPKQGMTDTDFLGNGYECSAGYFCQTGADVATPNDNITGIECPTGQYCPAGTSVPQDCGKGTFNNRTGQKSASDCTNCTGGYYCDENKLEEPKAPCLARYYCPPGSTTPDAEDCPKGHYCEVGTSSPILCTDGSYNLDMNVESCRTCEAGSFCTGGEHIEPCEIGHFCPNGTGLIQPDCPIGTYGSSSGLKSENECQDCDPGTFCNSTALLTPTGDCAGRYYCRNGSKEEMPIEDGFNGLCSAGYYCPPGTTVEKPCEEGTYTNLTGRLNKSECKNCPPGKYCQGEGLSEPTGDCFGGFYCLSGATSPNNPVVDSTGGPCPAGYQCPNGTSHPEACPFGYYNNKIGKTECDICPAGFYCPTNTTDYSTNQCPRGHYCLNGTFGAYDHPCPPGTFNDGVQKEDLRGCNPCTPGMFCNESGMIEPAGDCAEGWFCSSCSWSATPKSPPTTTLNTSCLCPVNGDLTSVGGECPPGTFCPEGSNEPRPCSPGHFCEIAGLGNLTSGTCEAGYFCLGGADSSRPNDGITGNICPPGYYCPGGVIDKLPCPRGTYSPAYENKNKTDCKDCPPGDYCHGGENITTGQCMEGYYCPGLSETESDRICPKGFRCPQGVPDPIPCEDGTHQDLEQQAYCKTCPGGYYCERTSISGYLTGSINPIPCLPGYYCLNGTSSSTQYPCPPGTFSNSPQLHAPEQCQTCLGGDYCLGGDISASGLCWAGFYCINGSETYSPRDDVTGGICPKGYYCENGTADPDPCPSGTFGAVEGLKSLEKCTQCTEGMACTWPGLTEPNANCTEGYFCPEGSNSSTAIPCPAGSYCPSRSKEALSCGDGGFTDLTVQSNCSQCKEGFYCTDSKIELCPMGFYCPAGTGINIPPCPAGTYGSGVGFTNESFCSKCDSGCYCRQTNLTEPEGPCAAGFFCKIGSYSKEPYQEEYATDFGRCPPGSYCRNGTAAPKKCDSGTYNELWEQSEPTACLSCPGGKYCEISGLAQPTGNCSEGYYCTNDADEFMPSGATTSSGPCPIGTFCPEGTAIPNNCTGGSYASAEKMPACMPCPAGSYCGARASVAEVCESGHYCLENSATPTKCPVGTFRNETGGTALDSCFLCTGGHYCDTEGLFEPLKKCAEGWYCTLGAATSTPSLGISVSGCLFPNGGGGECEAGYYCPLESVHPTPCDPGFFCDQPGLHAVSGPCNPGFYCSGGSIEESPRSQTYGDECPPGFYCPSNSSSPTPCPAGSFLNSSGGSDESQCESCTEGFYCPNTGTPKPEQKCHPGYFCPPGSISGNLEANKCPNGTKCPEQSGNFTSCKSGTYQSFSGQDTCDECEPGYYCNYQEAIDDSYLGVVTQTPCPAGFYCPKATEFADQYPCPIGSYNPVEKKSSVNDCWLCDAGKYCDQRNQTGPTNDCFAGYYCPGNSSRPDEISCPNGSYCPPQCENPEKCPTGTYGSKENLGSVDECSPCDPGSYCDEDGLSAPKASCSPGYYCLINSTKPNPVGEIFGDVCPPGSYCPSNSSEPTPCAPGTYNPDPQKQNVDACKSCLEGFYCSGTGNQNYTGECDAGYYCSGGAENSTQYDCQEGHFCPKNSPIPSPCGNGFYSNSTNSETCDECPAGWYCVDSASYPRPCPSGYYCLIGTGYDWTKCPEGTFNPNEQASEEQDCVQCSPGFYCGPPGSSNVTGPCSPGFDCRIGINTPRPDNSTNLGNGGPCEVGYQCSSGTAELCPKGTFSDNTGVDVCDPCTAGFYCSGSTVNPIECPEGFYCLSGTKYPEEHPCPPGTYNNRTGQKDEASGCLSCPGGEYCPGVGNPSPVDLCEEGYYCTGHSSTSTPQTFGIINSTISNGTCTNVFDCVCPSLMDTTGGMCQPGYYCPRGSTEPNKCTEGMYCPSEGMHEPLSNCSSGYYCTEGSAVPDQNKCTPGHYCPSGLEVPCSPGTFSQSYENKKASDCQSCTPGMCCEGYGNPEPTGNCSVGYYCPGDNEDCEPAATYCEKHHQCPEGSVNQTVCEPGYYQQNRKRGSCYECIAGKICDPYDGNLEPEACPPGYYCPRNTSSPQACPSGKYRSMSNGKSIDDCTECDGGFFCRAGEPSPSGPCDPGFYCSGGAKLSNPDEGEIDPTSGKPIGNGVCPAGFYCPNATTNPYECPRGTYLNYTRQEQETDCIDCPAGQYCPSPAMTDKNDAPDCAQGYVCYGRADESQPSDGITGEECPRGFSCPVGTDIPRGCERGTYGPRLGMSSCDLCPPGYMCPENNMTTALTCSEGFYCPENTSSPYPCPESTYNPDQQKSDKSSCLLCPPGSYCQGEGNPSPSNPCQAGFWCEKGSSLEAPTANSSSPFYNGPCPVGHYCEEGTKAPQQCPPGTLRNVTGARSESECQPCTPGYYCTNPGSSVPTDKCSAGYFCPGNDSNTNPAQYDCTIGHYCPEGSPKPKPCQGGLYQPDTSREECIACQAGYYCDDASSGGKKPCPAHSYCPEGSKSPFLCPNGTHSGMVGLEDPSECLDCPTGKYCTGGRIQADCYAGFFCLSRSPAPTSSEVFVDVNSCPASTTCAGQCPAGFYCLDGEIDPKPCPQNTLRSSPGASQVDDCMNCPRGKWCHEGEPIADPCPVGYYCSAMNISDCSMGAGPQACPLYTFRNITGGEKVDDCFPCPAGYWCNETGLSDFSQSGCALGFYCTGGGQPPKMCPAGTLRDTPSAASISDCEDCPGGFYCPDPLVTGVPNVYGIPCDAGYQCPPRSSYPSICPPGYYCPPETGLPKVCPPGYSCLNGSSTPVKCEYPFYCPIGTADPLNCDVGYQPLNISDSDVRDTLERACMECLAGSFRNSSDEDKCLPCPPGYYCPQGTANYQEYPCPIGNYCPGGGITESGGVTGAPIPCPTGTFGAAVGAVSSVCQPCPRGTYNNLVGQSSCLQCGSSANSELGASACNCVGNNRAFQPSDGACVCKSGYIYYDEADQLQSEGNSENNCEATVDDRCSSNHARKANDRSCVLPNDQSCDSACASSSTGGVFNVNSGTCLCNEITVPEEIECSVGCNSLSTILDPNTGVLKITTTSLDDGSSTTADVKNVYGPVTKYTTSTNTILIQSTDYGFYGTFPTSADTVYAFVNGSLADSIVTSQQSRLSRVRRRVSEEADVSLTYSDHLHRVGRKILQAIGPPPTGASITTANDTTTFIPPSVDIDLPTLENPVICLQLGEMLLFGISLNPTDRSLSNYPVYIRNHLFNTNPSFDYGAFRQLKDYVTKSDFTVNNFAHIFIEAGIYVFADAQNSDREVIVNVLPNGRYCSESRIQPRTESSLAELGVYKQTPTNLTPDFILISVVLGCFALSAIALFVGIVVWRPHDAGIYPMRNWLPRYRGLGEPYQAPYKLVASGNRSSYSRHNIDSVRGRGEAEGAETPRELKDEKLLEEFNVRTFYDKLEDQSLHISSQLNRHQNSLQNFYESINRETEGLKKMLNDVDMSNVQRNTTNISEYNHTDINRPLKLSGHTSSKEQELLDSLERLIYKLNSGQITLSDEVLEDARRRIQGKESEVKLNKSNDQKSNDLEMENNASLIRAQGEEKLFLERSLIGEEKDKINSLLNKHYENVDETVDGMNEKLNEKLQGDLSEAEVRKILAEHEREMEKSLEALDLQRIRQIEKNKKQLLGKRRKREEALEQSHKKQLEDLGLKHSSESENKKENFNMMEKSIEAAILEERRENTKEEINAIGNKKALECELTALLDRDHISDEIREKLGKKIIEQERQINQQINNSREEQMRKMRNRMIEKRRRRMAELEEQQKMERNEHEMDDEMGQEHAIERKVLEAKLDAEEEMTKRDLMTSSEQQRSDLLNKSQVSAFQQIAKEHKIDPAVQQEILEGYQRQLDEIEHVRMNNRRQQQQTSKAKLAARIARRTAQIQNNFENEAEKTNAKQERTKIEDIEKSRCSKEEENDGIVISSVDTERNSEIQALSREHNRQLATSKKDQLNDVERMREDMERKEKEEEKTLDKKFADQFEKRTRELKAKHEAEDKARNTNDGDKANLLLAAHQQEMEELEDRLKMDHEKQGGLLKEKMMMKRKRKNDELRRRQEIGRQRELIEQKKELQQVQLKVERAAEKETILDGIERNGAEETQAVIQKVLEKRQLKEMENLVEENKMKRKLSLDEAMKASSDSQEHEKEQMILRHESEMAKLEDRRYSSEEFAKRKRELELKNKDELKRLEKRQKREQANIKDEISNKYELELAGDKLKLKEKHYKEFAEAIKEFAPNSSVKLQTEEAENQIRRINAVKEKLEKERTEEEKRLSEERNLLEKEEEDRLASEMRKFEKEMKQETEVERQKSKKGLEILAKRKEKLINDQRDLIRKDVERAAAAGASEEEQKKIIEQHEKELALIENKMDQERLRMHSQLEERLKKRRMEHLTSKQEELERSRNVNIDKLDAKQKINLNNMQQRQMQALEETSKSIQKPIKVAPQKTERKAPKVEEMKKGSQGIPVRKTVEKIQNKSPYDEIPFDPAQVIPYIPVAPVMSEESLHKALASSPIYETLQEIQKYLEKEEKSLHRDDAAPFTGSDTKTNDDKFTPTPLGSLNVRELVAYKFGVFILSLLRKTRRDHPPVSLLVAEKIPLSMSAGKTNPFRGSFSFDEGNGILYIRRARLLDDSVGKLSLLLVHTIAHLATGGFRDETSPDFLNEFYQCLAALSDDLFFARSATKEQKEKFREDFDVSMDVIDVKILSGDTRLRANSITERVKKYERSIAGGMLHDQLNRKKKQEDEEGNAGPTTNDRAASNKSAKSSAEKRNPILPGNGQPAAESRDQINAEFVELAREAAAVDSDHDGGIRNRMKNVYIKLSDAQQRLRANK